MFLRAVILGWVLSQAVAYADPVTTGVLYHDFRDIADLALRGHLQKLHQVDTKRHPQFIPLFERVIQIVQKVRIPEDGDRPIRVIFVDDMNVNMAFVPTTKGPKPLLIYLGALNYFKNDDELAYMLGHELEHGLSQLNEEARQKLSESRSELSVEAALVNRVAENEVDAKSVFRRVHEKGFSAYAARDFMDRLITDFGDNVGFDHTKLSNRRNTVELELVGMSRLLGEKRNRVYRQEAVTPEVRQYFKSTDFVSARLDAAKATLQGYDALAESFVQAVKDLGTKLTLEEKKSAQEVARKRLEVLYSRYGEDMKKLSEQLGGVVSPNQQLDHVLRLQGEVARSLRDAQERHLPEMAQLKNSRQYALLREAFRLSLKSELTSWGQGGPLEDAIKDVERINEELVGLGKSSRERSRRVTLQRQGRAAKEQLDHLLSGYEDPKRALHFARAAQSMLDEIGPGSTIPQEYFDLHATVAHGQNHVGPELKKREQWISNRDLASTLLFLRDPHFDPLQLMNIYSDLRPEAQRQLMPILLPSYLEHFEPKLLAAKTREEFLNAYEGAKQIFVTYMGNKWDLRSELAANPASAEPVRRFFRTLVDHAPDAETLAAVIPEIEGKVRGEKLYIGFINMWGGGAGTLRMNAIAAGVLYDDSILKTELDRRLKQFVEEIRLSELTTLSDYYAKVDGFLDKIRVRIGLLAPAEQAVQKKRLAKTILHLAETQTPEAIRKLLPEWRDVVRETTVLRFPEDLLGQGYDAAAARRTLTILEESTPHWKGESPTAKYLGRSLTIDRWVEFKIRGGEKKAANILEQILTHPEIFLNGDRARVTKPTPSSEELRKTVVFHAWSVKKIRDSRLDAIARLATTTDSRGDLEVLRLYFSELWKERKSVSSAEDFEAVFKAIAAVAPSTISSRIALDLAKEHGMKDAQAVNMIEGLRRVFHTLLDQLGAEKINTLIADVGSEMFEKLGIDQRAAKLPPLERARYVIVKMSHRPGPQWDKDLEELMRLADTHAVVREVMMDPALVGKAYYEVTRRGFALWQLEKKFQLDAIEAQMLRGGMKHPGTHQRRAIVGDVQRWIDRQFPRNQPVKDTVINIVEDKLVTSPSESQQLGTSRLNFANWERLPEIVLVDLPDAISAAIRSSFDRLELIRYFTGKRADVPDFVKEAEEEKQRRGVVRRESPVEIAMDLKVRFATSPLVVRTAMLQALLDQDYGILSEKDLTEELKKLILGGNYDDKLFRTLFEVYVDSLPSAERKPLYGLIVSSLVESSGHGAGVSLKAVLEAMGPFGIKAGQFLRTSGLLPDEHADQLKDFLDRALPPDRSRITQDLQQRFGNNLEHFEVVRSLEGSGSINYVVRVDFKRPVDGESSAVVRIRRPRVEGQVYNENEIWAEVARRIRGDEPETAEVIEEARGHTYETLKPGGMELDLSIEVRNEEKAKEAYQLRVSSGPARGFEVTVGHPLKGFQKMMVPGQEEGTAIYRFVDATPLDRVADPELRAALAKEIVSSELRAIFERGSFDPDGHPGNWLVDMKNKRLVRIDYAQFRSFNGNHDDFKPVFRELVATQPNFTGEAQSRSLSRLLHVEGVSKDRLASAIRKVSEGLVFSSSRVPQQRLFDLRKALRAELKANIVSDDELRAGLAAVAKVRGFAPYLPVHEFEMLIAQHARLPMARAVGWFVSMKRALVGGPAVPTPTPRSIRGAGKHQPLQESVMRSLQVAEEVSRLEAPEYFATVAPEDQKVAPHLFEKEGVFKVESVRWNPQSRDEVHNLTPDEWKRLPVGTELFNILEEKGAGYIKGVDEMDQETRGGRTVWGIRGAEWEDLGGVRVIPVKIAAPADLDLSHNPYYTGPAMIRYTVITPEQYEKLPEKTVLFNATTGAGFLKGRDTVPAGRLHGHLVLGFPDNRQRGFEGWGTDACHKSFETLVGESKE